MAGAILSLFAIAAAQSVNLQVYRAEGLQKRAQDQYERKIKILPERGKIYDRNGDELAGSVRGASAFVRTSKILKDKKLFARLCRELSLSKKELASKIRRRPTAVTTIKRRLSPTEEDAARSLGSKWVGIAPQTVRFYPKKDLAANVLGFVGSDGQGLGGLEHSYDVDLRGREMWIDADTDARASRLIDVAPGATASKGHSLVLTLDQSVQHIVEDELDRAVAASEAKGGMAVVMDPATGEVLAMAQSPRFNPNAYGAVSAEVRKNKAVVDVFEPGSTLKSIFMAVALDQGKISAKDSVFCENGSWKVHGHVIHDHVPHATLSMADVLKVSSNIGVAKLSQKLSDSELYNGYRDFGLGNLVGIELNGESRGILHTPSQWSKIDPMTIAYGQGISVTALQLTSALAALGNGGVRMRPYLVRSVLDETGREIERTEPEVLGRAVSEKSAATILRWMERVVHEEGGTAPLAAGSGYTVAGKTGTAWKPEKGGYNHRKVVSSFMGIAPARDPKLAILIAVDEPTKGSRYGGIVAAPAFREIVRRILNKKGVPPDRALVAAKKPPKRVSRTAPRKDAGIDSVTSGSMPELAGLTMRETLRRLERVGMALRLDLQGSGFAGRQQPKVGTVLTEGMLCTVEFESPWSVK